jgi:hypothetical protein
LNTGILLLQKDKSLVEMNVTGFVNEDMFQELLEKKLKTRNNDGNL